MPVWLARIALAATLALPMFLMHGRAVAEILIGLVDACFLARCALARDWAWLAARWVRVAAIWWGWLALCSLPSISGGDAGNLVQAIAMGRFLLFVAALEHDVLKPSAARTWMRRAVVATALYIALQSLWQFATGYNVQGYPRGADGELTGPFEHPRAAAPLSRLLFPAALAHRDARVVLASVIAGAGVIVLIGQRMPLILTLFGLILTGVLLPRLRAAVLAAILVGAVTLGASAAVSPPTFHRLVVKFSAQMEDFPHSDYGRIAGLAVTITLAHPIFGQGFDAYRRVCGNPAYGNAAGACNIHPHNHYLEAATESGIPGLALFCALVLAWLTPLARGLWLDPSPLRVGLFVAAVIQEWPIASASGFTAIEIGGFFFLLLGFGLAEARAAH